MYTHEKQVYTKGKPLSETGKAMILIHGRGATAASIMPLAHELGADGYTLFAPQATNNTWYPYSFMAPADENQPALDSALELIDETVQGIQAQGIASKDIYILGFSQGACLTAEYAARHAQRFGALLIFTGGLIGEELDIANYKGGFDGTPVLITTGDPDPHVPVSRIDETVQQLENMGAKVTRQVYPGRPHTIIDAELELARKILVS
jgi:phospholipase/carboxylesterase